METIKRTKKARKSRTKKPKSKNHKRSPIFFERYATLEQMILSAFTDNAESIYVEDPQHEDFSEIFRCLHDKKFPELRGKSLSIDEMFCNFQARTEKRKEEKFKFAFKKGFRRMIDDMLSQEERAKGKVEAAKERHIEALEREVLLPCANGGNIPLTAFKLPGSVEDGFNAKTFNRKFIKLIKVSGTYKEKFMRSFEELKKANKAYVEKKLEKFLRKIHLEFLSEGRMAELVEYLKKPGSKLPWTLFEVDDAFDTVMKSII